MAIVSVVELPRQFEQEIGQAAIARRQFVANLSDDNLGTSTTNERDMIGIVSPTMLWGVAHPTFSSLKLRKVSVQENYEGDPYKALVVGEYGIVKDEELVYPVDRPSQWSAEAGSQEVPVLYYYSGTGNATRLPLTNSAYDYYQGLTAAEAVVRFRVVKNYGPPSGSLNPLNQYFPYTQLNAINHLNNGAYGGALIHTWKCAAVSVSVVYEDFGGVLAKYWATTSELLYRQTGWNLQLPDVGFNFLDGGQKRRAMVFDFENGEWVASPNPVGLNGSGAQTGGAPAILERRILPDANFTTIFGAVPS
jgi:hypothetical protein